MLQKKSKIVRALALLLAVIIPSTFMNGCAAGNYGFTRSVAKWNLRMSVIPRVLIYIVFIIVPVYGVAVLLDLILNNTIEFWSGKAVVNAKNESFERDGYRVYVAHTRDPLRKSEFQSYDQSGKLQGTLLLSEESSGSISVFVNGVKRGQVKEIDGSIIELITLGVNGSEISAKQEFDALSFGALEGDSQEAVRENIRSVASRITGNQNASLEAFAAK